MKPRDYEVRRIIIGGMLPNQRELLFDLADDVIDYLDSQSNLTEREEALLDHAFKSKGLE